MAGWKGAVIGWNGKAIERIGFLLIPRFSLHAFSASIEVFDAANRTAGRRLYDKRIISSDGGSVAASNGVRLRADTGVEDAGDLDMIVVCGGFAAARYQDAAVLAWLRRQTRHGVPLAALSDATFVLARAGLLDSHRCTIHWHCLESFAETYPHLRLVKTLFVIDGPRLTCAGGTAAGDMWLTWLALMHGRAFAHEVAIAIGRHGIRGDLESQRSGTFSLLGLKYSPIARAIDDIEQRYEEPLTVADIARRAGVSERQLQRAFSCYLGCTPRQYLSTVRLRRAREMLVYTNMPVIHVALACGFVSAEHFSRTFRKLFNRTPTDLRRTLRGTDHSDGPRNAE